MGATSDAGDGPALRFQRLRQGDRYGHSIEVKIDGAYHLILESIEPGAAQNEVSDWPPSPPLKDWHEEKRGRAAVLMAVGAAGKTHWSASIELSANGDIQFDVAARINLSPVFLGSRYRCEPGCRTVELGCTQQGRIELMPGAWLRCDQSTTQLRLDKTSHVLSIEPVAVATDIWPQTIRWRYWITRTPD